MDPSEKKKIGVLVVAYNAASTLAKVLDRIPAELRPDIEEVIVSDDHSQDSTYLVGLGYQQQSDLPITLIRQSTNLGYGGNQKAGYNLAIEHGLDIVVMLHGDGQYAPESLPEILAPLLGRRGRCRLRLAHHDQGRRPEGRHAALQVRWEPHSFSLRERCARHQPVRVPLGISRLLGERAQADPFREELRRVQLRHPDHHPDARRRHAHRRGPHPHLLRRRDLLRRRPWGTPRMSPRTSSPTGCRRQASATGAALRSARSTNSSRATTAHTAGSRSSCSSDRPAGSSTSGVRAACSRSGCDEWATTSPASTSTNSTG